MQKPPDATIASEEDVMEIVPLASVRRYNQLRRGNHYDWTALSSDLLFFGLQVEERCEQLCSAAEVVLRQNEAIMRREPIRLWEDSPPKNTTHARPVVTLNRPAKPSTSRRMVK
jgi:hypothetical protein